MTFNTEEHLDTFSDVDHGRSQQIGLDLYGFEPAYSFITISQQVPATSWPCVSGMHDCSSSLSFSCLDSLCLGTLALPQPLRLVNSPGKLWPSPQPCPDVLWASSDFLEPRLCLLIACLLLGCHTTTREQHNRLFMCLPSGIKMPGFKSLFPDLHCWPCVLGSRLNFLLLFIIYKMMMIMMPISYIWSEMKHVNGLA